MTTPGAAWQRGRVVTGFIERLLEAELERENPRPPEAVVSEFNDAADDDILAPPELQCDWLREIGFEQVDVYFKLPELAIFAGVKPNEERSS